MLLVLERDFVSAKLPPENQDPCKQSALEHAQNHFLADGETNPLDDITVSVSETNKKSEFILDNPFFTFFPERGRIVLIKKDNRIVKLTFTENEVFKVLAIKAGIVARFGEFGHIWESKSLRNRLKYNIHSIRHKLGDKKVGKEFRMIKSIRGVGFVLSTSVYLQQENQHPSKELGQGNTRHPEITIYERHQNVSLQDPNNEIIYRYNNGLIIYPERNMVAIGDENTSLTNKENKLLQFLAENPKKVLSRKEIAQRLWSNEDMLSDKYDPIKTYIRHVRRKIKDKKIEEEDNFGIIQTVRARGYIFVEP